MRVLIWATHLQTDILALTLHLDEAPGVEVLVVAPDTDAYLGSPIASARPLRCRLLDRNLRTVEAEVRAFGPDVVVVDNHFPPFAAAPRVAYMWHGLGWKARPKEDLDTLYRRVKALTGIDPRQRNPRFLAQCYGEPDRRWREEQWGLHPDCCKVIGMAFTDLLRRPPYDRAWLEDRYRIDVANRKTVLISLTWHYGGVFARAARGGGLLDRIPGGRLVGRLPGVGALAHRAEGSALGRRLLGAGWDADLELLTSLLDTARRGDANVLLCLHERKRYEAGYLSAIRRLVDRYDHVEIRHKDLHPDNLADLVVSDVMISNLSSFITYFYTFGRPTIHIRPQAPEANVRGSVMRARLRWGRVAYSQVSADEPLWMTEPEDNGGVLVSGVGEMANALERALVEPHCYRERADHWLGNHVAGTDGHTAARFQGALEALCGES